MFRIHILNYGCIYDSSLVNDQNRYLQSPVLNLEGNAAGTLSFKIGPDMDGATKLELLKNTIYVEQYDRYAKKYDIIWAGRVLENSLSDYNETDIVCEGALAYLNDSVQPASKSLVYSISFKQHFINLIEFHNRLMTDPNRTFDLSKLNEHTSYLDKIDNELFPQLLTDTLYAYQTRNPSESTFETINTQFLEKWGGYLKLTYELNDNYIINYLDYIDAYNASENLLVAQPIKFEENIVSITRTASADDFATALYPIGDGLDDVDKSWVKLKHNENQTNCYMEYDLSGAIVSDSLQYVPGVRIDPETGLFVSVPDSNYTIVRFIPVRPGERYFFTSYLKGVPRSTATKDNDGQTPLGSAIFAVHKADYATAVLIGESIQNVVDRDTSAETSVDKIFENDELEIPDGGAFLSIAVYMPNLILKKFVLKEFNSDYPEEAWSIMSVPATTENGIVKAEYHPFGEDIYPRNCTYSKTEDYFRSKIVYDQQLVSDFGMIIKPVTFETKDAVDPAETLYQYARDALLRMTEKVQLEVVAVDLSYLPEYEYFGYRPFRLLDLAKIESFPHKINQSLPILKMEIALDAPENSTYTLSNEVETRDGTPSYMTVYMSDMYKKGSG